MARRRRRRGGGRAPDGEPAARLRRRGARAARQPREGDRRPRVPAPGGRLRRVVQRDLDDAHPREAEDHAADVRRADLRRDAAGREGGADRRPVHEAALRAVRAGRRRGDPELPRPHGPRRRPHRRGARPRPSTNGRGLQPVGLDAEPAACVHEGRLRRPHPGAPLEQGLRLHVARGTALRPARGRDRARARVHGRVRHRPRERAPAARGRRLHEPRGSAARLRGRPDAPGLDHRRLVRLLRASALDRRAHAPARRRARRVLLRACTTRSA